MEAGVSLAHHLKKCNLVDPENPLLTMMLSVQSVDVGIAISVVCGCNVTPVISGTTVAAPNFEECFPIHFLCAVAPDS